MRNKFVFIFLIGLWISFLCCGFSLADPAEALDPDAVYNFLKERHQNLLEKFLQLETRTDGLAPAFRKALADRKVEPLNEPNVTPKALPDPLLIQAIVTERKRLEANRNFVSDLGSNPYLRRQKLKEMASMLLRLDTSEILSDYADYLDQFNRGQRKLPSFPRNSRETAAEKKETRFALIKFSAATLLASNYTKERKRKFAYSDPLLVKTAVDGKDSLESIESGLGPIVQDTLPPLSEAEIKALTERPKNALPQELDRVRRTRNLQTFLDKLGSVILTANKPFLDEYQYSLIKLKRNLEKKAATLPSK